MSVTDVIYHLGYSVVDGKLINVRNEAIDFSDVKFIVMGGSNSRARQLAEMVDEQIYDGKTKSENICFTARFKMYKVGQIVCVSHGMGIPSLSILLQETMKLMDYGGAQDVTYFRVGTSGGVDTEPGTVVITNKVLDGLLRPVYELAICGKPVEFPAEFDESFLAELAAFVSNRRYTFSVTSGATMGVHDFYEGQARLDGAFCCITAQQQREFITQLRSIGVKNIEMESIGFAAMTKRKAVKAAIVCTTIVDRWQGEHVTQSKDELTQLESRSCQVVIDFIKHKLSKN